MLSKNSYKIDIEINKKYKEINFHVINYTHLCKCINIEDYKFEELLSSIIKELSIITYKLYIYKKYSLYKYID